VDGWPADEPLSELCLVLRAPSGVVDEGSGPSRPPSAASVSSVTTDASASSVSERRRPAKRRKNLTGWPRAKVRKTASSLLKTAVSRAAATAAADRDESPAPS